MPRVSVIVPAYNAERFLAEALDSALAQTERPFEIIVVDDGSTDGTRALAERYEPPVRVVHQVNRGLPYARNFGAKHATGDWLAFLDADDIWLPPKLATQLALAHSDVSVVYSDRENFGDLDGLPRIQSEVTPIFEGDIFETLLLRGNMLTASSTMVRRTVFEGVGGFVEDPRIRECEDWDLWIRVTERHRVAASREPLVKYRLHGSSLSRNFARMNQTRLLVVARGLALERGKALPDATKRRIWAETYRTNAWDAARSRARMPAAGAYMRAIAHDPSYWPAYGGMLRLALGRV
jgi:glycosyltransferase involved in cell wall biosynthesis